VGTMAQNADFPCHSNSSPVGPRLCAPTDRRIYFAAVIKALFGTVHWPGSSDFIKVS
jgi:hypothetical protein